MNLNTVRKLTLKYETDGAEATAQKTRDVGRATDELVAARERSLRQMNLQIKMNDDLQRANDQQLQMQRALAQSYDQHARALSAANDNQQSFARGLVSGASSTLETVSHLKLLAVAAFALSPAFRGIVSGGVTAGLGLLGANAGLASAAMSRVATVAAPALSFFTRLSIPIGLAVAAFKLLGDTVERGSDLLAKYGGTAGQRAMFGTGVDEGLAKLTRFQDETVSAQQVQYAAQLGSRLEEAKRSLAEFFKVQLDLTDPALKLQNAWVVIVETLAKALTLAGQLPDAFRQGAQAVGNSSIWNSLPKVSAEREADIVRRINEQNGALEKQLTLEESLELAKKRLAAGMGGGFVGRFNQSIMDLANPPKIEAAAKAVNEARNAYDRAADTVTRHTAVMNANAQSVGQGAEEQERLRVQAVLTEAAFRSGGLDAVEKYAAAIDDLSKKAGAAKLKELTAGFASKADFDVATAGLGGVEKQIADIQFQLHGPGWKDWMNDGIAANMRLADSLKTLKAAEDQFGQSLLSNLLNGQKGFEALANASKQYIATLSSATLKRVQDGGSFFGPQTIQGNPSGAALTGVAAGVAGYQSGSPLAGALGGAMAGAMFGPAGMAAGALIGGISGLLGEQKQEKDRIAAAQKAWADSKDAAESWMVVMKARSKGGLQPALVAQVQAKPAPIAAANSNEPRKEEKQDDRDQLNRAA